MDSIQPTIPPLETPAENLKEPARVWNVDPSMLNGGGARFQRLYGPEGFETPAASAIRFFSAQTES